MSIENVKAFREAVNESKELQEKIAAGEDWVEVAKAANFEFTAEELRKYSKMLEDGDEELSDSELDAAAGGQGWLRYASFKPIRLDLGSGTGNLYELNKKLE